MKKLSIVLITVSLILLCWSPSVLADPIDTPHLIVNEGEVFEDFTNVEPYYPDNKKDIFLPRHDIEESILNLNSDIVTESDAYYVALSQIKYIVDNDGELSSLWEHISLSVPSHIYDTDNSIVAYLFSIIDEKFPFFI